MREITLDVPVKWLPFILDEVMNLSDHDIEMVTTFFQHKLAEHECYRLKPITKTDDLPREITINDFPVLVQAIIFEVIPFRTFTGNDTQDYVYTSTLIGEINPDTNNSTLRRLDREIRESAKRDGIKLDPCVFDVLTEIRQERNKEPTV